MSNPSSVSSVPAVERAVRQMVELDRCYHLSLWPAGREADCVHDLGLMHAAGDLTSISTELVGHDGAVLLEHTVRFDAAAGDRSVAELAVPVVDRRQVTSGRFLISSRPAQPSYRDRLRLRWNGVAVLPRRDSDRYGSEHGHGEFHVGKESRRRLVIKQAGARGFAFADDPGLGAAVFLHLQDAPPGFTFHPGQAVTALVVSTSRGLQARVIRPA